MNNYISHHNSDGTSEAIATCTHQLACAWLREKGYHIYTFKRDSWVYEIQDLNEKDKDCIYFIGGFKEHDTAIDEAIEYVLKKLI